MKNSTVLVYNRINKSGSTSMASKIQKNGLVFAFTGFSGLLSRLSKMNRFLILTGVGPKLTQHEALTWVQVIFSFLSVITRGATTNNCFILQQRYMVPQAVKKMAKLFCDQIDDR